MTKDAHRGSDEADAIVTKMIEAIKPILAREVQTMLHRVEDSLYPKVRKDLIEQLNGPVPAKPGRIAESIVATERDAKGRAPKGAAQTAVRSMLKDEKNGLTWGELEALTDTKIVSFSAVKKAVKRMKDAGDIDQRGNRFLLV